MTWNAICLRNVWFELNGNDSDGGAINFQGVRSVRIDDSNVAGRIWLTESSVNLYNCQLSSDAGGVGSDNILVDNASSLVAYEHRYDSYPSSKVFVNSISYDGSLDLNNQWWQPTSVWGPLRVVIPTIYDALVSEQFASGSQQFDFISGGSGTIGTTISPNLRVLGSGSGYLSIGKPGTPEVHIKSHLHATVRGPVYCVWSIHTYLLTDEIPEDQLYGMIGHEWPGGGMILGRVYFKYHQWVCSYGMKLVNFPYVDIYLHLYAKYHTAEFVITDYQIVVFNDLYSANSFVNSRAFAQSATR